MPKITELSSHPAAIFSVFLRKCLTNSGLVTPSVATQTPDNHNYYMQRQNDYDPNKLFRAVCRDIYCLTLSSCDTFSR